MTFTVHPGQVTGFVGTNRGAYMELTRESVEFRAEATS
jgi:hypothetical protein